MEAVEKMEPSLAEEGSSEGHKGEARLREERSWLRASRTLVAVHFGSFPLEMGNKPEKQTQERNEILVKAMPPLDQAYVRWLARDLERLHGVVPKAPRAIKPPDHYIEYMRLYGLLDLDLNDPDLAGLLKK
ncbi:hypothetical protein J5N97_021318 [Dioscorea zingiberensis]|uniref:Uncharacterized protein n=1 Tax=Dioscorea zingiberensis TaxID=325984 RepID=A0A9D5CI43_9LILI|nr:hypothetical protein J5N97_021318 [Dioscorea zingiberensis]